MSERFSVAILGATGMVGQRFIALLAEHPWFTITALTGSERRSGQRFGDAVTWRLPTPLPAHIADLPLLPPDALVDAAIVFSALPADEAHTLEPLFASRGHFVFSNASSYRMAADIPLLIPEINPDHLQVQAYQQQQRGWTGMLITNPNCSTIQIALALKPLHDAFRVQQVQVTTMQAISGAGYPGVASYDILGNVVPYIGSEEEKIERETRKILGSYHANTFTRADIVISAQCNRVPVLEGHMACISVAFGQSATTAAVTEALRSYRGLPQHQGLPSAPDPLLVVREEADRPQPLRDGMTGAGMAIVVGRIRPCPVLGHKFVVLGHNTIRGAAGASILNAELMVQAGSITNH